MYTVVNIGGMSHTGSTVLGRILANDPRALFLGEIEAVFGPTRKHHYEYIRRLSARPLWSELIEGGVHQFYLDILNKCEDKDTLVDCSKSPLWISARNTDCQKMGLLYRNVLIYKTPYEMAASYNARNKNWLKGFERYFRRYFRCVDEFYVIAYKDLLESRDALHKLCTYLGQEFRDNKKNYWENSVEELFGSEKANTRRTLKYEYTLDGDQEKKVRDALRNSAVAQRLWTVLDQHRNRVCMSHDQAFRGLRAGKSELTLWAAVNRIKKRYRRVYPEDYFTRRILQ